MGTDQWNGGLHQSDNRSQYQREMTKFDYHGVKVAQPQARANGLIGATWQPIAANNADVTTLSAAQVLSPLGKTKPPFRR